MNTDNSSSGSSRCGFRFFHYFVRWWAVASIPAVGYYVWLLSSMQGGPLSGPSYAMAFLVLVAGLACASTFAAVLALAHAALRFKRQHG
jgi:hypothetical protein